MYLCVEGEIEASAAGRQALCAGPARRSDRAARQDDDGSANALRLFEVEQCGRKDAAVADCGLTSGRRSDFRQTNSSMKTRRAAAGAEVA